MLPLPNQNDMEKACPILVILHEFHVLLHVCHCFTYVFNDLKKK